MKPQCIDKIVGLIDRQRGDGHLYQLVHLLCEKYSETKLLGMIAGHCWHSGKPKEAGKIGKTGDEIRGLI